MRKENRSAVTIGLFSVLLFGIGIINQIVPEKTFSENENRTLQTKPKLSVQTLLNGNFSNDYETYLSDQFIGRNQWITLKTKSDRALGKQEVNGVYFGKDGYFIEKHTKDEVSQEQYEKNLARLTTFTETYSELFGNNHIKVMLVPTASSILREQLPAYAPEDPQNDILNTVEQSIKKGTFLDLQPILNEKKEEGIYYKTDHHWTTLGAYYAYVEWANSVGIEPILKEDWSKEIGATDFLGTLYSKVNDASEKDTIELWTREGEDYEVIYDMGQKRVHSLYERKYLNKKDKYSVFLDGNHGVTVIKNKKNNNGKKLIIIKDSYANCFAPFVAAHFEEVHLIDLRYFNLGIKDYVKQYEITDMLLLYHVMSYATDVHTLQLVR